MRKTFSKITFPQKRDEGKTECWKQRRTKILENIKSRKTTIGKIRNKKSKLLRTVLDHYPEEGKDPWKD